MNDDRRPGFVIDLAAARTDAAARRAGQVRGVLRVAHVDGGEAVAVQCFDGETLRWRYDVPLGEVRALVESLQHARVHAQYAFERTHQIVKLAWCDTRGRATTARRVRGRIVERTDTAVRVAIEPAQYEREPREGWPPAGWYRLDGWPTDHPSGRRGWCVMSGLAEARR